MPEATQAADHSPTRPEVQVFVAAGPLPDWDAGEEELDRRVQPLEAMAKPVTGEEARALVSCFGPDDCYGCFGPDDCYGVAWTLLHLIETGPNPVLTTDPGPDADVWHQRLHHRAVNGQLVAGT
ncbi:hypothetical protein ACFV20_13780 [Streptomyces sp. NPDC059696]|uniref:hypothetical protein n=1 Tax=Streptomyces sp. NPDC059696 TaxID=3346911 RepID=UPI0036C877A8